MRQKRRSTQDKFLSHFVYPSSLTFFPLRRSLRRSFSRRDSVGTGEKKANFLSPPLSAEKWLVRTKKKDGGGSKPRANIRTSVVGFGAERPPRGGVCVEGRAKNITHREGRERGIRFLPRGLSRNDRRKKEANFTTCLAKPTEKREGKKEEKVQTPNERNSSLSLLPHCCCFAAQRTETQTDEWADSSSHTSNNGPKIGREALF